jgi:hypothetical protein
MAKRKITPAKAKASAPVKSNGQPMSVPDPRRYHVLGLTHCALTAPYEYMKNDQLSGRSRDGSLELYSSLHPENALQSVLASLIISVSNATNDCLSLAARVPAQELQHRDVNLRHGLKGAAVVTQLIDAFERVRGNRPGNVSVGKVNVESGGQAIVGTVQSSSLGQEPDATIGSDHTKAPGRK